MSILQPPGDATGSDRSNGTPATPGPSHRRPTESSRGRGRGMAKKQRDERDFETPESLRGIIQGLEESRNRSDKKMEDRFEIIMGAINRLTQRVDETESRARTRPSVEQSPTRSLPSEAERPTPNPSDFRTTVPEAGSSRTAGATYDSFLQPPNLRNLYETSPTPTINNARSKLTEKIEPLGDGTDPSFRQWRISIRDRFVVNADHYTSEVTRKALIWSTTTGLARSYLEPRYQSDHQDFRSADEMIRTLESYFTTGYETEEYRNQFHDMVMGEKGHANETFPEFTARFRSMAVLGNRTLGERRRRDRSPIKRTFAHRIRSVPGRLQ
ncbi:hypothetical protein N431DRAFT_550787 [Stipitochalara longipes BDJ]|nr:hypothetical protein N431DRAFT_550787 [Stipitochalara longipes BDJ]